MKIKGLGFTVDLFSCYFSCIDVCCNFISEERELLEPNWGSLKSVTLSIIAQLFKMSS